MSEFADLPEALIIARGAAVFRPDPQFNLPRQDLGEVDVSVTTDITYTEAYSRKHLVRRLLQRIVNTRVDTVDITAYQKRAIVRLMKNMGVAAVYQQAAAQGTTANIGAAGDKVLVGQVDPLPAVGVFNVSVKVGSTTLNPGVDYIVLDTFGQIEYLTPQTGARVIKFDNIAYTGTKTPLGVLPEVRGHLDIYPVSEDGAEAVVRSFYIGVAPNGAVKEISGDDGETGWTFQGRVYTDPLNPAFASGAEVTVPSEAAIQAAIAAAAGGGN